MSTLTRKQRENATREQLILDCARRLLSENGYLGLTMDRVAEATEYSKGTIYQHFANKEDLIGALASETLEIRAELFARAAAFDGHPRERISAIGVADGILAALHKGHADTERLLQVSDILDKTTEQRKQEIIQIKSRQMETLLNIVVDAKEAGDLTLDDGVEDCFVLYGLWTMAVGHSSLGACARDVPQIENVNHEQALWTNYQKLLDGYDWKPLSKDWDYQETIKRVYQEVFPDEYVKLNQS